MASVFLSYDHDDAAKARSIAIALEKAGHSVWWDPHIKGGSQFSMEIEQALNAAAVVVVLWSQQSVGSAWVRDEAAAGRDTGRLVPAMIDGTAPPLGFRQYQAIDLSRWKGRGKTAGLAALIEAVEGLGGGSANLQPALKKAFPSRRDRPIKLLAGMLIALLLVSAALLFLRNQGSGSEPTVQIVAADQSPAAIRSSRQLLINLGNLQSAKAGELRLIGQSDKGKPTLIFEAGGSGEAGTGGAGLILLDGKDRSLLWSHDFEPASGSQADLDQQVAFTAARILSCASEGLSAGGERLDQATLKLYLSVCGDLSEAGSDPRPAIPALLQVIAKSPRFGAAWAKLLLTEAEEASARFNDGHINSQAAARLRTHIAQARRVEPAMAEAIVAETMLLPPNAFGQRLALLDQALDRNPDNVAVLNERALTLGSVGRMRESVRDAARAADLDPLSPQMLHNYVAALAYAGNADYARKVVEKAERLWPGTTALLQIQYRYHLRFGDPKKAERLASILGESGGASLFLKARIDPSQENIEGMIAYMRNRMHSGEAGPSGSSGLGITMQAMGQFDRRQELIDLLTHWPTDGDLSAVSDIYFRPALNGLRRDPRFMRVAQRAGLLHYWRESKKWPDFCFAPDLPYDCKAEAAKLG
jgi:tetratricopeptide (TPR) repeat protein